VGGATLNPTAIPRLGVDAILPMGLTLGGAVGLTVASVSDNPNGGTSQTLSGTIFLVSPRIGYRISLGKFIDLNPRLGVTVVGGSINSGTVTQQSCTTDFMGNTTCTNTQVPGSSASLTAWAFAVDVPVAVRLTDSFSLLAGVAFDDFFSVSASTSNQGGPSQNGDTSGAYWGLQAWLGLGGYL
jgi:hypothetical protein